MTLVDDDVAEVVLRVVGRQEVGVGVVGVHVERLIGRDEDAGVLLRIAARHGGGVRAEDVLEGAEPLASQFVPIADEERPAELAGIADALEQVDRDEASCRRPWRGTAERALLAARELLQHGPDRGVLVVAARALLASRVARDQRTGLPGPPG